MDERLISASRLDEICQSERRGPTAEEQAAFRRWIKIDNGTEDLPEEVEEALYFKAWEGGHANGYVEVDCQYADLADLVLFAYRTGQGR